MPVGRKPHVEVLTDPAYRPVDLSAPDFLSPRAKEKWNELVPQMEEMGLAIPSDVTPLVALCTTWATLRQALDDMEAAGSLYTQTQRGWTRHPSVVAFESASRELRAWCSELGLTASAQARLHIPRKKPKTAYNPFAAKGQYSE